MGQHEREDSHGIAMTLEPAEYERRCLGQPGDGARAALIGLLLVLGLTLACASQQTVVVWEKPGATPEELEAARATCLAEVEALQTRGVNRTRVEADATGACFVACMRRHGFTWRTEKVSTRDPGPTESTPAQEPFDSPVPSPPPECSVPPEVGRDGS